jgi:long-chain acyl-CoA synthetase
MLAQRLFDLPHYQLKNRPNERMFVTKINGVWVPKSTKDFVDEALSASRGLIALGVKPGDNVALVTTNRIEWNIMDIAIQQVGAIVVPLYPNISESDYTYILNDAKVKTIFVGNEDLASKIAHVKPNVSSLEHIFSFDLLENQTHWRELMALGEQITPEQVEDRMREVKNEDLATIIYTSGTTGNPKGVMLSHRNILSNVEACEPPIPADQHSRVLTFLPVCHIYERMLHYLYMHLGCSIHFAESIDTIGDNIREIKPHVFSAVPRLIEKVFDKIMAKGDDLTGIKRQLFFWAVKLGEAYDVKGKSPLYKAQLAIARKLIFSKWQEALGGEIRAIASGSAALQPRLARIFLAAGIPILEGYGLTESSPVVSVNCFTKGIRIGSVGALIDNVEVKIASDGEILVKGPNIMMGYYNLPESTAETIDEDGWLHTGDIGEFIEGVYLKITDRKKEIFKTSGGKYIVPQVMENKFKESRFIEQIMVIGEGEKFPAAFIVPNFLFVSEWAKRKGHDIGDGSNESLVSNPHVIARIQKEVDGYNSLFGNWEQLKKTALLSRELSVEANELTPTLKLKRKIILGKYQKEYNEIYL